MKAERLVTALLAALPLHTHGSGDHLAYTDDFTTHVDSKRAEGRVVNATAYQTALATGTLQPVTGGVGGQQQG